MQFYQQFSTYYDHIFKTKSSKVYFLLDQLPERGKVLDVAAGTGNYALEIATRGHQVQGLDLSKAMIDQAVNKAANKELDVEFKVGDMKNLADIYQKQQFDLIYCIGNSLVHLADKEEVKEVLEKIYDLLSTNSKLVIQIVNYDRILAKDITSLPTINNQEKNIKLIRNYKLKNDQYVDFNTTLITSEDNFTNSVRLLALQSRELRQLLQEVGFEEINFYGNFNYAEYKPLHSFPLISVAAK